MEAKAETKQIVQKQESEEYSEPKILHNTYLDANLKEEGELSEPIEVKPKLILTFKSEIKKYQEERHEEKCRHANCSFKINVSGEQVLVQSY